MKFIGKFANPRSSWIVQDKARSDRQWHESRSDCVKVQTHVGLDTPPDRENPARTQGQTVIETDREIQWAFEVAMSPQERYGPTRASPCRLAKQACRLKPAECANRLTPTLGITMSQGASTHACKKIVGNLFKRSACHCKKTGANALLAVKRCIANDRLADFLDWKAYRVAAA